MGSQNAEITFAAIMLALLVFAVLVAGRKPNRPPTGSAQYWLVCVGGPHKGRQYAFNRSVLTIGRDPGANIVLSDDLMSRQHARLELDPGGQVILEDTDSTNGTWVNDQRIARVELPLNQPFRIGASTFAVANSQAAVQRVQHVSPTASRVNAIDVSEEQVANVQFNRLQLQDVIGKGGAALVYLAQYDGKPVAVKVLQKTADPYFKQKFATEAEIGKRLNHPHIVRSLDYGQQNGVPYIVMEWMRGGSLRDLLQKEGVLSIERAVQIVGQICLALDYAHQNGIYHRDLKPENILFVDKSHSQAKLSDFGIARLTGARTVTRKGILIGTPEYMSYDQAKGLKLDGRSDQYSLGVVLYEMLTLRRPFTAPEQLDIVQRHLEYHPPNPDNVNRSIPRHVNDAIMRALRKNREQRFPSMSAMAQALGYFSAPANAPPAHNQPSTDSTATPAASAVLHSRLDGNRLTVAATPARWGRRQFGHPALAEHHATTWFENGAFYILDPGSQSGILVNGQRIPPQTPIILGNGANVTLGPVVCDFIIDHAGQT